jgi:hypothetical protein
MAEIIGAAAKAAGVNIYSDDPDQPQVGFPEPRCWPRGIPIATPSL